MRQATSRGHIYFEREQNILEDNGRQPGAGGGHLRTVIPHISVENLNGLRGRDDWAPAEDVDAVLEPNSSGVFP